MKNYNFFVYITTNPGKTVLYTGVTNDLYSRMEQHFDDCINEKKTFAGKYFCYNLIYFERHTYIQHAIEREKEIKGWSRDKKKKLIDDFNPGWKFLNNEI
ncbi:MAG: GIY-YIG nuclease family protein [Sporocytophaga sp.]|nr:GIY-YIG nuclease family protein [Sporocytophaga sp.]